MHAVYPHLDDRRRRQFGFVLPIDDYALLLPFFLEFVSTNDII